MKDIEKEAELFIQLLRQMGYVKVINCRDCKYYDFGKFECKTDQPHSGTWMPESYCDRAEREYFKKGFFSKKRPIAGGEDATD